MLSAIWCRFTFIRDMSQLALSACRQCLLRRRCLSPAPRTSSDMMSHAHIHNGNLYIMESNWCLRWLMSDEIFSLCVIVSGFGLWFWLPQSVAGWFFGRAAAAVSRSINTKTKRKWQIGKMDILSLLFFFFPFFLLLIFFLFLHNACWIRLAPSGTRDTCNLKYVCMLKRFNPCHKAENIQRTQQIKRSCFFSFSCRCFQSRTSSSPS